MKALIVTALITLLAGCAGTGGYSSGDMGSGASSRSSDPLERDPVFNLWIT